MDRLKALALAMFFSGLALFIIGVMSGDTKIYLAVIIPIIQTSNVLSIVGLLLMFGAFFLWMVGAFTRPVRGGTGAMAPKTKAGGVILIGPIPILFSNDKNLAIILLVLSIVVIVLVSFFMVFII